MSAALTSAIQVVADDQTVRAVLLRARGKCFCAGGDISEFVESLDDLSGLLDRQIPPLHQAIYKLATLPVPVVSALNGPIGGGGIGLALCADIVIAAQSMKLRGGYSAIGLTPDVGASWFLTRRVGAARAKEIFFTNAPLSSNDCLRLGVVSQVCADDELDACAVALVESLARASTASLARTKVLVDGAAERSLLEHLDLEHRFMVESGRSPDAIEGITAFQQKKAAEVRVAPEPPRVRRVGILCAAGAHFTAGLDLAMLTELRAEIADDCDGRARENTRRSILNLQDTVTSIERCRKPVIAEVHAACVGGGIDIISACDMRYCSTEVWFSVKEIDVGLAAKSPLCLRGTKEMINYVRDRSVADGLNYIATWNAAMLYLNDLDEAGLAMRERRAPVFKD